MFAIAPCDVSVFETAPTRYVDVMEIPRPADAVWADLVADGALSWCRMLGGATWTSPRPFGVGTTRTIRVAFGVLFLEEQFFRWEEGRRKSFYVAGANVPLFAYMAEDYLIEPTGPNSCRFTWTIAGKSSPLGAPGQPLLAAIVRSLFADTRKHFGALA